MGLFDSLSIPASGLNAQRQRMNMIAQNLANAQTTRTEQGGPYQRKIMVLGTPTSFRSELQAAGVEVKAIVSDPSPGMVIQKPGHPDADENGTLLMPNVNTVEEMVDLMAASKSYEANLSSFEALRSMMMRALDIGK